MATAASLVSRSSFSTVIGLLFWGGPSAVLGRIAQIIVNSIKGHPFRRGPHIREEGLKLKPSITNRDSSTSISIEVLNVGISAPTEHCSPNAMDLCSEHPMCREPTSISFCMTAPAGLSGPKFKSHRVMAFDRSTFANAAPFGMLVASSRNVFQGGEVTKNITCFDIHIPSLLQLTSA